jgi:hypothetical protein
MLDSVRGIFNSTVIVVFYGMFPLDSVRGIYSSFFCIDWSLFSMFNCQIGGMLDSVRGIFSSTVIEVVLYKVHNISLLFFGLACLCFPCPSVSITEN